VPGGSLVTRPWERYAWLMATDMLPGFCVSVADHGDVDRVAVAFGIDPASETVATIHEAWYLMLEADDGPENAVVQIGVLNGCVVAVEPDGWAGVNDSTAAEASRGGQYASLYQSVNADMRFVYAVDGTVVRAFDPLLYGPGIDPDEPLIQERDLPFGEPGDTTPAAFVLIERLTGLALTCEWLLEERRPAFRRAPA
jgi:Family of unknown function (DUF6461)